MKQARVAAFVLVVLAAGAISSRYIFGRNSVAGRVDGERSRLIASVVPDCAAQNTATRRYRLDASQSRFIAHAFAGGLLWFKGHDHLIAVREFTGQAQLTSGTITPASLQITANTASMVETGSVFTEPQKTIINGELRDIVLEPAKYPNIDFYSTEVMGKTNPGGEYEVKIKGYLSLRGVTRAITIPALVTVTGNDLRARGEFSIDRSDFGVKATSAFHGLVRVRNKVKFEFDIVGHSE